MTASPMPFLSAWDPRAAGGGSVDPIGALRAYTAIATCLMPGVTTITTRARYLSWVCAGLQLLDECGSAPSGGRAGRARRLRVLPFERLLALAVARAGLEAGHAADHPSWRELRGIRRARSAATKGQASASYFMLKNQGGVGGVGTYWVTLVEARLVEGGSATLTPAGQRLAETFLAQRGTPSRERLRRVLVGEAIAFEPQELRSWGERCSLDLDGVGEVERSLLSDALLGPREHRRVAAALGASARALSSDDGFATLQALLDSSGDELSRKLGAVVAVARPFEALHRELLYRFNRMLSADAIGRPVPAAVMADLAGPPGDLPGAGHALATALDDRSVLLPHGVRSGLKKFLGAVRPVLDARDPTSLRDELLRHHERVQAGRVDPSRQPKRPWIERIGGELRVAPRFALRDRPAEPAEGSFTHSYRIEQLAAMLDETKGWQV